MKKLFFKKVLLILDEIEVHGVAPKELYDVVLHELSKVDLRYEEKELRTLLSYLFSKLYLKNTPHGIDLSPCATIFAKADSNSMLESLALFECLYRNECMRHDLESLYRATQPIHRVDLYDYIDELSCLLLLQTSFFENQNDFYQLRKEYRKEIYEIIEEYKQDTPLLSIVVCAYYTTSIIRHGDPVIEYKNKDASIVRYPRIEQVIRILPRRGVPCDRNETKALQVFYKDTLFHEHNHACPLCNIDIPHMLIASHIKPFRDCAHIYEAIDHNNGLLLCRNHDYLFDQGYISFADDGKLLISKKLAEHKNQAAYCISSTFYLPNYLLTKERKLFLAYHRDSIYRK